MSAPLLVIDEPFRTLWCGRDPFEVVESLEGKLFRELAARRTLRFEVADRGYFVKIHRGVGWAEILKNLLILRLPVLGAINEWLAIKRLGELGIDTMRCVAFGQRGIDPASRHSFIVTEALEPTISLEDFCRHWRTQPPALALKRALIQRVAEMAARMHRNGVNHRDFYLCHLLLHQEPPPTPTSLKLSIIDLHRVQVRRQTPRRWRDKDLASLYFSVLEIGLTRRDLLRFLRIYFGRTLREILRDETRLLAYLVREAERLRRRYVRKFANNGS